MARHLIKIDASTNELSYSHEIEAVAGAGFVEDFQGRTVRVKPNDEIQWEAEHAQFGVHFKNDDSPFESGNWVTSGAMNASSPIETVRSLGGPTTKTFSYFAVVAKKQGKKEVITDDPDIIVDSNTGGGGPPDS